ncbi:MAG: hypothetical protein H7263_01925 [Candidatus Sericytochromatia bacterium]|nr:hypothetical protein [Candidatus Sericytochromatia bacterium]
MCFQKKSELIKKENILAIRVSGNPYEIGFQHGELLKEYVKDGVYKYFSGYIVSLIKNDKRIKAQPLLKLALKFLQSKSQKFINRVPLDLREEIRGLADGSQINYATAQEVFVLPEIISYLVNKFSGENYAYKTHLSGASIMGCTSIVAMSEATQNKELLHGRNFDFMGIDAWDKYPLVSYVYPDKCFSYISIGSVGLSGGVITAINEKQISYALHQNYTKEFSENNLPILALGNLIMKYADDLDKAKEIILSSKSNSGWSVIISDNKSKTAFIAEICADKVIIRDIETDLLVYTNSYLAPEFHEKEIVISPPLNISSNIRFQRINQLAAKDYFNITPENIIAYLGDRYDTTSEKERVYGYSISQNHTVASVVFAPDRNTFWLASGKTPVCNNKYLAFSFDFEQMKKNNLPTIEGHKFTKDTDNQALKLIMESNTEYEAHQFEKSLKCMLKASKLCGNEEPNMYYLSGMLYIKLYNFEKSFKYLQLAYDHEQDIYKSGVIKLWLGRLADLTDRRDKAVKHYRYVEQMDRNIYHEIYELAKKGIRKPYNKKSIKYINLAIWYGEELVAK